LLNAITLKNTFTDRN